MTSGITDAQIHESSFSLAWDDEPIEVQDRLRVEVALAQMDGAGVDAAIVSTPDIRWAVRAAELAPGRLASTPDGLDFTAPDIAEQVQELRGRPGVLGVRVLFNHPPENVARLEEGAFDPLLKACRDQAVPIMAYAQGAAEVLGPVARAFPDQLLIVDHFGLFQPPFREPDDPPFKRLPALLALAEFPNVAVKFSGAPSLSAQAYPYRDVWPHLLRVVEAFGPERLMWGSDIQRITGRMASMPNRAVDGDHNYADAVRFVRDTEELGAAEKAAILGGTLRRLLGWPTPEPHTNPNGATCLPTSS